MILLLLCLTSEVLAQYNFLRRGNPSPYDSGVVVEITEYRKIRKKVMIADSLVIELNHEISQRQDLEADFTESKKTSAAIIARHEATIADKDKTIRDLSQSFDKLAAVTKKFVIFKNPIADVVTKVLIGVALTWGINQAN